MGRLAITSCLLLAATSHAFLLPSPHSATNKATRAFLQPSSSQDKSPAVKPNPLPSLPLHKLLSPALALLLGWQSVDLATSDFWTGSSAPSARVALAAKPASMPTAAGSRVNKDADSLLRFALPINSKEARDLQEAVEALKDEIRLKRYQQGVSAAGKAKGLIVRSRAALLSACRSGTQDKAGKLLDAMQGQLEDISQVYQLDVGRGSEQERAKLDKAYVIQDKISKSLSEMMELMVPADYKVNVPEEFANLPQLQGRATVEMVMKKPDESQYDINGKLFDQVKLSMVIDGYSAPVTGGNFVDLVQKGFYNGLKITRSDGFVVQFGDPEPEGTVHGYVPPGKKDVRNIPLEIFVQRDPEPMYGLTTEDDARGYAATVLPFQAYGAIGMAREEYNPDSASSQVFWLLFESDLTPAGKNLLDGRYACLGYTVENADQLIGVKEGDVIVSAKVVSGLEGFKKGGA